MTTQTRHDSEAPVTVTPVTNKLFDRRPRRLLFSRAPVTVTHVTNQIFDLRPRQLLFRTTTLHIYKQQQLDQIHQNNLTEQSPLKFLWAMKKTYGNHSASAPLTRYFQIL